MKQFRFTMISGLTPMIKEHQKFEKLSDYFFVLFNEDLIKVIRDNINLAAKTFFDENPEAKKNSKYYYELWKALNIFIRMQTTYIIESLLFWFVLFYL